MLSDESGYLGLLLPLYTQIGNGHGHEHTWVNQDRKEISQTEKTEKTNFTLITPAVMTLTSRAFSADPNDISSSALALANPFEIE